MPNNNKTKFKGGEWFSFCCEVCDISKSFKTKKERLTSYLRHKKFCDVPNIDIKQIETTNSIITKVGIL
jgi:uncharacterized metal-binding protein